MEEILLKLDDKAHGAFYLMEGGEQLGEMEVSINGSNLTVYHTEVSEKAQGRGYAKKILDTMTDYARKNKLQVIPLCPYVHAQFKRKASEYQDLWKAE